MDDKRYGLLKRKFGKVIEELEYLIQHPDVEQRRWVQLIKEIAWNPRRFSKSSKRAMSYKVTDALSFLPVSKFDEAYWEGVEWHADNELRNSGRNTDEVIIESCKRMRRIASAKRMALDQSSGWDPESIENRLWRIGYRSYTADQVLRWLIKNWGHKFPELKAIEPTEDWSRRRKAWIKGRKERV